MCSKKSFAKLVVPAVFLAAVSAIQIGTARAAISLDQFTVVVGGWQLEQRCNHLSAVKHDNLGRVAAAAEVEAARKYGVAKVAEVLKGAEQFGEEKGANCGDETSQAVMRSYEVAAQYAASRNAYVKSPQKRTQTRKRESNNTVIPVPRTMGHEALTRYGTQTEAYYLQRRCHHLPYNQDLAFWNLIKTRHYALIREYGAGAVGRVSRQAKANANSASVRCGPTTYKTVRTGLRSIRRDVVTN